MADTDIVQVIAEARIDARSLSEFVFKPAGFMVQRRLAPPINTLQFYIDRFNSLNSDFSSSVSVALSSLNNSVAEAEGKVAYIESTVQDAISQSILASGFVTIDSFELGATITQRNQALRHTATGKLYRWAGDLPKVVAASSTPTSSGGFGDNAWLEVSDTALRQELSADYGVASTRNSIVVVDSVSDLLAIPAKAKREDLRYLVKGYHAGSNVGGGFFSYSPSSALADDGGRRIGSFVRDTLPNDTPFTFAKYGYDFENHSISGQVIAQKIFDTALTMSESEHIVIEISDGVIFTDSVATLNRANLTMRGNGTAYVSGAADGTNRFIEILLSGERNKNLVLESLKFIGLFDGTLLELYQNRSSEYGRRFYVSGADGVRVRGVTAKRIAIPMDIRNSNNVQVNNLSLTQGNCGLSVINSTSVNISNITGIDCTGSVIDFSDVRGGTVSNITGFTSEDGRGYAEEFFDMGSCKDLAISNLQSTGPTGNMIRIKFESVDLPFSNIRISNVVGRGSAVGVIIQPSTNDTGTLTEHIHIDGITIDSTSACIAMTGTTRVYNVSIANFNLISRGGAVIELPGVSDINISNGSAFCAAPNNISAAILLGKRAASGGIAGDRIRLSNVSVGSSNLGREAVNITEANGVFMSDVTVTQSERDGITFANCRDVNLSNMDVNKTGRSGIIASFSATTFTDGEDVGFRVKSSKFTDFGYTTANRAAIALTANGISISGVDITGNHARVTPLAPANVRHHTLFTPTNGGGFGLGSIFARNTTKGIQKIAGGNVGSVLVKDNDAIDIAPVEPPVEPQV